MRRPAERRLPTDADVHDAVLWRLADWTTDEIAAWTTRVARLLALGVELDERRPEVKAAVTALTRPHDRRDGWTALLAFVALVADSRGDAMRFLLAGFEVVIARRNSATRAPGKALSPLTRLIVEFQKSYPDACADDAFYQFGHWAAQGHPVLADFADDRLTYESACGRMRDVSRDSFRRQFRRARLVAPVIQCQQQDGKPHSDDAGLPPLPKVHRVP